MIKFFQIYIESERIFYEVMMNQISESFNIARHQYITGYQDNKKHIFPTLDLIKDYCFQVLPYSNNFSSLHITVK